MASMICAWRQTNGTLSQIYIVEGAKNEYEWTTTGGYSRGIDGGHRLEAGSAFREIDTGNGKGYFDEFGPASAWHKSQAAKWSSR